MREVFVLIPSLNATGPVKGAVALANGLAAYGPVTLAVLKQGPEPVFPISPDVRVVRLAEHGAFRDRLTAYRRLLKESGGREHAVSVSMCLSADFFNALCKERARIIASVRGNLPQNYRMEYGPAGLGAAAAHLVMLRRFDDVTAMSESMAGQIRRFLGRRPEVIHNFIDEAPLEQYRAADWPADDGVHHFVFVGSLTKRKNPMALVDAVRTLTAQGVDARITLVGDGSLRGEIDQAVSAHGLQDRVELTGQLSDPYPVVAESDVFVLPSLSEGVSRAALEALYLGVPCVMRDVDANRELIQEPQQGRLFSGEEDLAQTMLKVSRQAKQRSARPCLLPEEFRQQRCLVQYLEIIEA